MTNVRGNANSHYQAEVIINKEYFFLLSLQSFDHLNSEETGYLATNALTKIVDFSCAFQKWNTRLQFRVSFQSITTMFYQYTKSNGYMPTLLRYNFHNLKKHILLLQKCSFSFMVIMMFNLLETPSSQLRSKQEKEDMTTQRQATIIR